MAFVPNALRPIGRNSQTGNVVWYYSTTADTIAQATANNYFNNTSHSLALNDVIIIQATDRVSLASVGTIGVGGGVTLKTLTGGTSSGTTEGVTISDGTQLDAGGTPPATGAPLQDFMEYIVDRLNIKIQDGLNVGNASGAPIFAGNDTSDIVNKRMRFRRIVGQNNQQDLNFFQSGDTIVGAATTALLRQIANTGGGLSLVQNGNSGGSGIIKSITTGAGGTVAVTSAGGGQQVQLDIPASAFVSGDNSITIGTSGGKINLTVT